MKENKLSGTDSLRLKGVAVILMLMHHLFANTSVCQEYGVIYLWVPEKIITQIAWFGKECVAIFAFISAYGLTLNYINSKNTTTNQWCINRLLKLYKGYWFIYIFSGLVAIVAKYNPYYCDKTLVSYVYGIIDFFGINNVFRTPSLNGAWWYMEVAIEVILLIPLATVLFAKMGCVPTLLITLLVSKILGVNLEFLPSNGNNSFVAFFLIIMLGISCAKFNLINKIIQLFSSKSIFYRFLLCIINTALLFVMFKLYITLPANIFYDINYGLTSFILIIWLKLYIINIPLLKQALLVIGENSMNIFLIHIFIRSIYAANLTFSFKYWELILLFLLVSSLLISILLDFLKKLLHYNEVIDKLFNILKRVTTTQ